MSKHDSTKVTFGLGRQYPKEYAAWADAKQRCRNPKHASYWRYGAAGISICDRWADSFGDFLADVGPATTKKHTLDRFPDKKGNYEPGNVRWATFGQQLRNTSRTVDITYNGITKCREDWAKDLGIKPGTLRERINKWGLEKAMSTPPIEKARKSQRGKLIMFRGTLMNLSQIKKATNAPANFFGRIKSGWTVEEAVATPKNGRYKRRK